MFLCRDQNRVYAFLCIVLLAVRMVADVTESRNVTPSFEPLALISKESNVLISKESNYKKP